jgi:hypothetical protein
MKANEPIRALSWKEPYASLMLHGKIETRTWGTKYRGLVLICSSKKAYTHEQVYNISGGLVTDFIRKVIGRNYDHWQNNIIKQGYAIAMGRLVDCRPMKKKDEDKCFVRYNSNLWCHIYEDVRAINPFPWKGSQGWKILTEEQISKIELK